MVFLRLTELRNKCGYSQAYVAQHLQITHQAYSLYETNKRQMNYETLCMLADFYEVSTDYLLGREEAMPSYLNEDERAVIERYKVLDEGAKKAVKNCLDFEYSRIPKVENDKKVI